LSHCWGTTPIFRLLTGNIETLQKSLPVEHLPQTFQDAILLTRRLGIEYIWIDSLCIIQDSITDWAKESVTMGDVYKHAYCNIAATGFPDGQKGLYVKRDPQLLQLLEFRIPSGPRKNRDIPSGSYYCIDSVWENEVIDAPLNKRAWVFQERYLSPRILHFGARQLF
jgi:hypothetical protein